MQRGALFLSLALHATIIGLMFVDFHFAKEYQKAPPAVLMVDLTKVKIADKTNLPQKATKKKATPKTQLPKPEVKASPKITKPTPKTEVKAQKPQPKEAPTPKNAVAVAPPKSEKKASVAPSKKTPQKKETSSKPKYNLNTLLASVEKVRQDTPQPQMQEQDNSTSATDNGTEGRIDQLLTISEKDFIASSLKDCWNIDGGAQNIDEIVIEIRVLVNKDGSIREAHIVNNMNLPAFKSLAESARRAVFICAKKGADSPFKILSEKYAEHYKDWKELYLNFNPMDANIF